MNGAGKRAGGLLEQRRASCTTQKAWLGKLFGKSQASSVFLSSGMNKQVEKKSERNLLMLADDVKHFLSGSIRVLTGYSDFFYFFKIFYVAFDELKRKVERSHNNLFVRGKAYTVSFPH